MYKRRPCDLQACIIIVVIITVFPASALELLPLHSGRHEHAVLETHSVFVIRSEQVFLAETGVIVYHVEPWVAHLIF